MSKKKVGLNLGIVACLSAVEEGLKRKQSSHRPHKVSVQSAINTLVASSL